MGRTSREENVAFLTGAVGGELVIQRCLACGAHRHPPAPMCGECGSLDHEYAASSGRGRVVSWIRSHHPNRPDEPPTDVVLVDLPEGVRVVSNLVDVDGDGPFEGLEVVAEIRVVEGHQLPVFRPAGRRTR